MTTKRNTKVAPIATNMLNASVADYAATQGAILAAGLDVWPEAFVKCVEFSMGKDMSLTDSNADDKTAKSVDDDAHRFVEALRKAVDDAGKEGISIDDTTARSRKSALRAAIRLGTLQEKHGINGLNVLADARKARKAAGDKAKPIFDAYYSVAVLQNKAETRLSPDDDTFKVAVTKKAPVTRGVAAIYKAATEMLEKLYKDNATIADDGEGYATRLKVVKMLRTMTNELIAVEDAAIKAEGVAEAEAKAASAREAAAAELVTFLAKPDKVIAASAKSPTKRGK